MAHACCFREPPAASCVPLAATLAILRQCCLSVCGALGAKSRMVQERKHASPAFQASMRLETKADAFHALATHPRRKQAISKLIANAMLATRVMQ